MYMTMLHQELLIYFAYRFVYRFGRQPDRMGRDVEPPDIAPVFWRLTHHE